MNRLKLWLIAGALIAIVIGYLVFELHRERAAHLAFAFRADSIAAALDTTRAVDARAQKVLGDSLRGVEIRAVQLVNLKVDALDKALRRVSAARFNSTTAIRPLADLAKTAAVTLDSTQNERKATFVVDSTPYHVRASVSLPQPPSLGRIGLSIRTDTAHMSYRVQCGEAKDGGVKPASVEISGPTWLTTSISGAETNRDVCNSAPAEIPLWKKVLWASGGVGVGWLAFHH